MNLGQFATDFAVPSAELLVIFTNEEPTRNGVKPTDERTGEESAFCL
jgi:hypothetical protein